MSFDEDDEDWDDRPKLKNDFPDQPIVWAEDDVIRFRGNSIVRHLLDNGPFDMNTLATLSASIEDRAQFAQLIGYSVSGYGDLSYVPAEVISRCDVKAEELCEKREKKLKLTFDDLERGQRFALRENNTNHHNCFQKMGLAHRWVAGDDWENAVTLDGVPIRVAPIAEVIKMKAEFKVDNG